MCGILGLAALERDVNEAARPLVEAGTAGRLHIVDREGGAQPLRVPDRVGRNAFKENMEDVARCELS